MQAIFLGIIWIRLHATRVLVESGAAPLAVRRRLPGSGSSVARRESAS
jgi:hypothetical protein